MKKEKKTFSVGFDGKDYLLKDYIECKSFFSKLRGLMFRPEDFKTPLIFRFNKQRKYAIHSFFCRKFIAIWISDGKILEKRIVKPWRCAVIPKKRFDTLIEIPL